MQLQDNWYFHFTGATLRDGRPIPRVGEWLVHTGRVVMCKSGLHASKQPWDALQYAPGDQLHLVELDGVVDGHDKVVARRRRIVQSIDAARLLRLFAVDQTRAALARIPNPDPRSVRACDVAEAFANGRATQQELEAAWEAAWEAAREAAQEAAREAAQEAAWEAAQEAAQGAAWGAAQGAAWGAAWEAAREAARKEFNRRVYDVFGISAKDER